MPNFSHLNTESSFPDLDSVNVYQYDNQFDYERFDIEQMKLTLCDVPWDMGEAHVGQRTITGIGNVVYFETPEKRDAYFDAIPDAVSGKDPSGKAFRFTTKFKELHRDQIIDIPIPYNVAALFNYLVVEYMPFASADSPVMYETGSGKLKWFWFVREVEFVAPNTTRLHLLDDAFQTWIYDVNIEGMILERGHAPMFRTRTPEYLQNPVERNHDLLTEDVNYGSANIVSHIDAVALNSGDMWACIVTSADPTGDWGARPVPPTEGEDPAPVNWKVPTSGLPVNNGVPSFWAFAMEPDDLSTFLSTCQQSYPQFTQTIQAVFFASKTLLVSISDFTFAGVQCHGLGGGRVTYDLTELKKQDFGYEKKYADLAKLYTSPYAHLEVTDENGNVDVIKVEDTTGKLQLSAVMSLAYPFLNIQGHLIGVGGSATNAVTFKNISEATYQVSGTWYETLREWNVPTFAVTMNPAAQYDYSTYFDREQARIEADNTCANEITNATTNRDNALYVSSKVKTNEEASADTIVNNAALQVAANSAITSRSNTSATSDSNLSNALSQAIQAWEAGYTRDTTNNEVDSKYASAAIGAAGGVAGSVISGAASGGPIGAIGGLISGAVSGATSIAQTAVAANLLSSQAEATVGLSQSKVNETSQNNLDRTSNQNSANSDNTNSTNTAATGVAANQAATMKANASRTKDATDTKAENELATTTAIANANKATAYSAIQNGINQAALNAPQIYGTFANGQTAAAKPMALFCNVVTQSKAAIAAAGDEFLRYGYMYDMQWEFSGNWNIGKYFTYWKLKDFWVKDLQVPDLYMDKLRFFLFGGVTIWRDPKYIGKVSVYDNFN